ncbi:basic endochitinase c [Quercus suber]|uniref:chitinase n=1 Tax=Quercus suber TaxID=58331 RepID=A0AAW0JHL8_QUESU
MTSSWAIIGNVKQNETRQVPGYGVITNIIKGGIECGRGYNDNVANRIGFYKRYSDILGVGYGNNLDCYNQRGWATGPMAYMHKDIVLLRKITSKSIQLQLWASSQDPTISFKTAIWFWMTPQGNKPSSHDVIIGNWRPSAANTSASRVPGYGVITNIINVGLECGHGSDNRVADRIGFYKRYYDILGVSYGNNLDCYNQKPLAPN